MITGKLAIVDNVNGYVTWLIENGKKVQLLVVGMDSISPKDNFIIFSIPSVSAQNVRVLPEIYRLEDFLDDMNDAGIGNVVDCVMGGKRKFKVGMNKGLFMPNVLTSSSLRAAVETGSIPDIPEELISYYEEFHSDRVVIVAEFKSGGKRITPLVITFESTSPRLYFPALTSTDGSSPLNIHVKRDLEIIVGMSEKEYLGADAKVTEKNYIINNKAITTTLPIQSAYYGRLSCNGYTVNNNLYVFPQTMYGQWLD